MKDSKTIISHLKQNPSLKVLKFEECYSLLIGLLPKSISRFIKFIYIKNDTLFFVLNHASAKTEFNYKRNLIKELLNKLKKFHPACECIDLERIQAFVSNKRDIKEEVEKKTDIFYVERALGEFNNNTENEKLHAIFEKIREEILKNND